MNEYVPEEELVARRQRLGELMETQRIDAFFVPPGSDLEYLTGMQRDPPRASGSTATRAAG